MSEHEERDDIVLVGAWMRQLVAEPLEMPALPNPAVLWWKAQMLRQWDAQRQVVAPLNIGEFVQVGLAACGSLVLLSWVWRDLWGRML